MKSTTRPTTLYKTPFCKDYWKDAAAELKNTKILIVAALLIALRVVLKGVAIPIAPNLKIQVAAPLINALGAMIFGPVVAGLAACVSDTLGCILFPSGPYFFPCIFVEVAGSVLMALFFYRAQITITRVIFARFFMDLFVNIGLNSAIMCWYYQVILGKSYVALILPAAIKNICMFPIEAFLLALFLSLMIPITYKLKLTFDGAADRHSLKFSIKQFGLLMILFAVGVSCMVGYLFYHYDNNSLSKSYSAAERYEVNCQMVDIIQQRSDDFDNDTLVATVESAYRKFGRGYTTYNVAVYTVDEKALEGYEKTLEEIRGLSKSKAKAASQDGVMSREGTAKIVIDNGGKILDFEVTLQNS